MASYPEVVVSPSKIPVLADTFLAGGQTIFTLNLAHMRMLETDSDFLHSYLAASIVTLDSMVVNKIGFRGKFPVATGSDLVRYLIQQKKLIGQRVLIIGNLTENEARELVPTCELLVCTPSFGFIARTIEVEAVVRQTEYFRPDLIFIAVGAPQSEKLALSIRKVKALAQSSILCCGAAFEFELGIQQRCPAPLRMVGCEWLWRMATNPARLFPRYYSDFKFLIGYLADYRRLKHNFTIDLKNFRIRFEPELSIVAPLTKR